MTSRQTLNFHPVTLTQHASYQAPSTTANCSITSAFYSPLSSTLLILRQRTKTMASMHLDSARRRTTPSSGAWVSERMPAPSHSPHISPWAASRNNSATKPRLYCSSSTRATLHSVTFFCYYTVCPPRSLSRSRSCAFRGLLTSLLLGERILAVVIS
jgi:hypothetical protein